MWIPKWQRDLNHGVDSPVPTQVISNEEFIPRPQNKQQKQVETLIGELEIERKGGIEVRKRLEHERDAVIPKRSECAEFGFGHDAPTIL